MQRVIRSMSILVVLLLLFGGCAANSPSDVSKTAGEKNDNTHYPNPNYSSDTTSYAASDLGHSWDASGGYLADSSPGPQTGIGLTPGGAQDSAYFRKQVQNGIVPLSDDLTVEGLMAEHTIDLPAPKEDRTASLHGLLGILTGPAGVDPSVSLMLGMNTNKNLAEFQKPLNLAIVIDRSGSMSASLSLVKQGVNLMIDSLKDEDTVSIVAYSGVAAKIIGPTLVVKNRAWIKSKVNGIYHGGSTNLHAGMIMGYQLAEENASSETTNRIILMSDGKANAGETNEATILEQSKAYNKKGIGITTIGIGGSFNQSLMLSLAQAGGGNHYYIDSPQKLTTIFVEELGFMTTPVLENLKIKLRLSDGFTLAEMYGFDYKKDENGWITLTGPSKAPSPDPVEPLPNVVDVGTPTPDPVDPTIPTVFASKRNGVIMMRLSGPAELHTLTNLRVAEIEYSYNLYGKDDVETHTSKIELPGLVQILDGGFEYFTDNNVRKGFVVLQIALKMKLACDLFHEGKAAEASEVLAKLESWTTKAIEILGGDEELSQDLVLIQSLASNISKTPQPGTLDF